MPAEFQAIFARFVADENEGVKGEGGADAETVRRLLNRHSSSADLIQHVTQGKGHVYYSDDEGLSEEDEEAAAATLSKRKQKKLNRLSVAELKRLVSRPDVVDWVDVSAQDPRLLVYMKSYRNTIPVPPHWSAKRDYLAGKKGLEQKPFQLPST